MGVVDTSDAFDSGGLTLVAGPGSRLLNERQTARLDRHALVDLPDLTSAQLHDLVDDLAAAGVMMRPRDAVLHPEAWQLGTGGAADVTPVLVGALCILVGLLEVVLLVGAAFAVAARRQVRDLGLLVGERRCRGRRAPRAAGPGARARGRLLARRRRRRAAAVPRGDSAVGAASRARRCGARRSTGGRWWSSRCSAR